MRWLPVLRVIAVTCAARPARAGVGANLGGDFSGETLRAHAGFGCGLYTRSVESGLEVGWLSGFSRAMFGERLGFRI